MTRRFSRRSVLRAGAVCAVSAALGPQLPVLARETDGIPLVAGWNSHTWCGPDLPIAEAVASLPLRIAHGWDIVERRWLAYAPNTPINTIGMLRHGQPLLLNMNQDATWSQPTYRGALPEALELPVGWSYVGWSGLHEPVWNAFGVEPYGSVAEARRWNNDLQEWISYSPGQPAEQLFAILHPGDAVWLRMRIAGARWNPANGIIEAEAGRPTRTRRNHVLPSLFGRRADVLHRQGLRSAGRDHWRGSHVALRHTPCAFGGMNGLSMSSSRTPDCWVIITLTSPKRRSSNLPFFLKAV